MLTWFPPDAWLLFTAMQLRDNEPGISIIIPVHNGAATIERQLRAIANQISDWPWEVVVVDNRSTDGTKHVVESIGADLGLDIRVVDAGARKGINHARNRGVEDAYGTHLIFCDGDDEAEPGWLAAMQRAFAEGAELLGGSLRFVRNGKQISNYVYFGVMQEPFLPYAMGANMGFSRRVYDETGPFDESYYGGSDDLEFEWRAQIKTGVQVVDVPDAVMRYEQRLTPLETFKQRRAYERQNQQLVKDFAIHGMPVNSSFQKFRKAVNCRIRLAFGSKAANSQLVQISNADAVPDGLMFTIAQQLGRVAGFIDGRRIHGDSIRQAKREPVVAGQVREPELAFEG